MSNPIVTQIVEQVNDLPDNLQEQVLKFVLSLRQTHLQTSSNAWMCWNLSPELLKPLPIGQPNLIIISTAHPNIRKPIHEQ
jgi:hypothetical protein